MSRLVFHVSHLALNLYYPPRDDSSDFSLHFLPYIGCCTAGLGNNNTGRLVSQSGTRGRVRVPASSCSLVSSSQHPSTNYQRNNPNIKNFSSPLSHCPFLLTPKVNYLGVTKISATAKTENVQNLLLISHRRARVLLLFSGCTSILRSLAPTAPTSSRTTATMVSTHNIPYSCSPFSLQRRVRRLNRQ